MVIDDAYAGEDDYYYAVMITPGARLPHILRYATLMKVVYYASVAEVNITLPLSAAIYADTLAMSHCAITVTDTAAAITATLELRYADVTAEDS